MEFTLFYRGTLKASGSREDKQSLRRHFHVQMKELWKQHPALKSCASFLESNPKEGSSLVYNFGGFQFIPLISERIYLIADLDIIILKPEPPGQMVTKSGDIDNRLKTLLDAMKMPKEPDELPTGDSPKEGETPFFCVFEDDNLITNIRIKTDRLLDVCDNPLEVVLLIKVRVKTTVLTWENIGLGG